MSEFAIIDALIKHFTTEEKAKVISGLGRFGKFIQPVYNVNQDPNEFASGFNNWGAAGDFQIFSIDTQRKLNGWVFYMTDVSINNSNSSGVNVQMSFHDGIINGAPAVFAFSIGANSTQNYKISFQTPIRLIDGLRNEGVPASQAGSCAMSGYYSRRK